MEEKDIKERYIEPETAGQDEIASPAAADAAPEKKASFFSRLGNSARRWFNRAGLRSFFRNIKEWFRNKGWKRISPSFFVMLFFSFTMWFMIKLSYEYTATVPVFVNIEGHELRVSCVVQGEGYNIMTNRFVRHRNINLKWSDLEVTPSAINPQAVVISPYSLQYAISGRKPDLKIVSMGSIPEVEL